MKKGKIIGVISIACTVALFTIGCNNDRKEEQRDRLESAYEKELNGEPMTEEEYNTLKSFHEWEDKQSEKTYEEWEQ